MSRCDSLPDDPDNPSAPPPVPPALPRNPYMVFRALDSRPPFTEPDPSADAGGRRRPLLVVRGPEAGAIEHEEIRVDHPPVGFDAAVVDDRSGSSIFQNHSSPRYLALRVGAKVIATSGVGNNISTGTIGKVVGFREAGDYWEEVGMSDEACRRVYNMDREEVARCFGLVCQVRV